MICLTYCFKPAFRRLIIPYKMRSEHSSTLGICVTAKSMTDPKCIKCVTTENKELIPPIQDASSLFISQNRFRCI